MDPRTWKYGVRRRTEFRDFLVSPNLIKQHRRQSRERNGSVIRASKREFERYGESRRRDATRRAAARRVEFPPLGRAVRRFTRERIVSE